jgi:hypothetical protein
MIKVHSAAALLLCAVVTGIGFAPSASGDAFDKKTIVTFSAPVEIPGKVLPAGTYVFKLLDSAANRNIVQIFDKDQKQLYATILAIPDYRLQPSGDTVMRFDERPAGTPEALRAWFYPGDNFGQHFVYPQDRATELAKANKHNVLAMPNSMREHITAPADSAQSPSVAALKKTEVTSVDKSGKAVRMEETIQVAPDPAKP